MTALSRFAGNYYFWHFWLSFQMSYQRSINSKLLFPYFFVNKKTACFWGARNSTGVPANYGRMSSSITTCSGQTTLPKILITETPSALLPMRPRFPDKSETINKGACGPLSQPPSKTGIGLPPSDKAKRCFASLLVRAKSIQRPMTAASPWRKLICIGTLNPFDLRTIHWKTAMTLVFRTGISNSGLHGSAGL